MIRSEGEYAETIKRLEEQEAFLKSERARLRAEKRPADQIKRLLEPVRAFRAQLSDEVEGYERLKRGEFKALRNLRGLGQLLIGLRIFTQMSQKDLADRLGVHETQVSRDEKNEYHNVTLERAQKILDVFGVELRSEVIAEEWEPPTPRRTLATETKTADV